MIISKNETAINPYYHRIMAVFLSIQLQKSGVPHLYKSRYLVFFKPCALSSNYFQIARIISPQLVIQYYPSPTPSQLIDSTANCSCKQVPPLYIEAMTCLPQVKQQHQLAYQGLIYPIYIPEYIYMSRVFFISSVIPTLYKSI